MKSNKKISVIPLIVTTILISLSLLFLKPNKLITYTRANIGDDTLLVYTIDKNIAEFEEQKKDLADFFVTRGISGTAYKNKNQEYYVTLVPNEVEATTEKEFGFEEISPSDFYKKVYNTRQVYFTRTLTIIR